MRHGSTEATEQGLFVGWLDPPLSARGLQQAAAAGELLRQHRILPRSAHCSRLIRSINTCETLLAAIGGDPPPVRCSWELNERHYGALQGMSKSEAYRRYGPELYRFWRRSFNGVPPEQGPWEQRALGSDAAPSPATPARAESLAMVRRRVSCYWDQVITVDLRVSRTVLVVAHSNSLRALVMHIEGLTAAEIESVDIPVAMPLVYQFDATMRVRSEGVYLEPARAAAAARDTSREGLT
jgi:2,3-bisphosphoglycerate-dependent phosphoglycerate mutase